MAHNTTIVSAGPEAVFEVLANPNCYPEWVVGASSIRKFDPQFPAVGARFHHKVGMRPFTLSDHSEVIAVEPPRRLLLAVKARPFGTAYVDMVMTPVNGGTQIDMTEKGKDIATRLLTDNPIGERMLHARNTEALRRLKGLVEDRARRSSANGA